MVIFRSEDTASQSYIIYFHFLQFVITSHGNHDNHCLFCIILLRLLRGYLHTKFEASSINQSRVRA